MSRAETSGAIEEVLLQPAEVGICSDKRRRREHKLEHGFRCSPFAVHSLVQGLSQQHKSFVHEMGFGSLLELPRVWMPRLLVTQLLSKVDCRQGTLIIGPVTLSIKPLIWKIVGLPAGPTKVPFSDWLVDQSVKERFHTMTLANLKMGLRKITDKKEFQQSFLLFVISSLLCPTTQASINRRFYASASSIDGVQNMDWCDCIYTNLMEGIRDYQELPPESREDKIYVKGCVYILAVIFLDFLDDVQSKPAAGFPRMIKINEEHFKPYKKFVDWSRLQFLPLDGTVYASASHEETDADAAAASALMMLANVVDSTSSQDDMQAEGILKANDSAGDDDAP